MGKLIVLTGLDGSGTTSVAEYLHKMDPGSALVRSIDYPFTDCREKIDRIIIERCPVAHYLFYLASVIYASAQIEELIKGGNVYCVRYLIDTVVSHRVAGLPVDLVYETELYRIKRPDLTIFLSVREDVRQARLEARGKGFLDRVLDDENIRLKFLREFERFRDEYIEIDTTNKSIEEVALIIRRLMNER